MNKYKITVYAIAKNEEQFVDRWMDSVSEADEIVVLDTGSTDNTIEKLLSRGATVKTEIINPWRFDVARNLCMDLISEDTDVCVMNDLDEVFESGWRAKLEEKWNDDITRARYTFVWSHNPDNSIKKQYPMEKIHRRKGFRWVHPVHEVLEYKGDMIDKIVDIPEIILHHYPDLNKPRSQYLPLLELSQKENPFNDRVTFWLGREYLLYEKYNECISMLQYHLNLPTATWEPERSASMRYIGISYEKLGDKNKAKLWYFRSISECPTIREPYAAMIQYAYIEEDWLLVYSMVNQALKYTIQSEDYLVEPENWGYSFYDFASIAAYHLGLLKEAEKFAKDALNYQPEDQRLKNNLLYIQNKLIL